MAMKVTVFHAFENLAALVEWVNRNCGHCKRCPDRDKSYVPENPCGAGQAAVMAEVRHGGLPAGNVEALGGRVTDQDGARSVFVPRDCPQRVYTGGRGRKGRKRDL